MRMQVDPTVIDRMEVSDIFHMFALMNKSNSADAPSEERYDQMIEKVRAMNMPDVKLN